MTYLAFTSLARIKWIIKFLTCTEVNSIVMTTCVKMLTISIVMSLFIKKYYGLEGFNCSYSINIVVFKA